MKAGRAAASAVGRDSIPVTVAEQDGTLDPLPV